MAARRAVVGAGAWACAAILGCLRRCAHPLRRALATSSEERENVEPQAARGGLRALGAPATVWSDPTVAATGVLWDRPPSSLRARFYPLQR